MTDDLFEVGYILSDGSMADFSGRRWASGYVRKGDRYMPKRGPDRVFGRNLDHRQLPHEVFEAVGTGDGTDGMRHFMAKTGAVRVSVGVGLAVYSLPTVEAISRFVKEWVRIYGSDRPMQVDALDAERGGTIASEEIGHPTVEKIMDFLEGAFSRRPSMGDSWRSLFKRGPLDWSPSRHIPGMPIWPEFVDGYLEAALWSSNFQEGEHEGEPLDSKFSVHDFDQESINKAVKDSNAFIQENRKDLEAASDDRWAHGKDFWLTRNGHGVGFWDRDYEKEIGERLTEAAHKYGERHVDVEGKKLHIYG